MSAASVLTRTASVFAVFVLTLPDTEYLRRGTSVRFAGLRVSTESLHTVSAYLGTVSIRVRQGCPAVSLNTGDATAVLTVSAFSILA
jgi:hypothetical protein